MRPMERIEVPGEQGGSRVIVGCGLLEQMPTLLSAEKLQAPRSVVSNTTVGPLYGRAAAARLDCPAPLELPDGEEHKHWLQVEAVCRAWVEQGLHRDTLVAAVGGGVVTDTVGFAAAVYLRGVDWLAVPTTLLAMVDAAVGGKTGVNLPEGKNMVGAFWAPRLVVADVATLATLPGRELRAGAVEAVKTAWIGDRELLGLLDRPVAGAGDLTPSRWVELVTRAVRVKADVVGADEREAGRRRALNLGHTVGHALESATGYRRFKHGEAVAWGLRAVSLVARRRGLLSGHSFDLLEGAIRRLGPYPGVADLEPALLLDHLRRDKKRDDLGVAWVLPTDDGVLLDQRLPADEVLQALEDLRRSS